MQRCDTSSSRLCSHRLFTGTPRGEPEPEWPTTAQVLGCFGEQQAAEPNDLNLGFAAESSSSKPGEVEGVPRPLEGGLSSTPEGGLSPEGAPASTVAARAPLPEQERQYQELKHLIL